MQKLLIEISHEDQIFVENECTNKGFTLATFFKSLLEDYKNKDLVKIHKGEEPLSGEAVLKPVESKKKKKD